MSKHATIKDIASAAGVSVATVSYILNNTPGKSISEETRNRVITAAQELCYIPNTAVQRLKTRRSKCIAVRLTHSLSMPRYHNLTQGIRSALASHGYNMLMTGPDEATCLTNCINACLNGVADGIIYVSGDGAGIPDKEMDLLRKHKIPVSAVDCMGYVQDVSSVVYDYYSCSRDRVDILINNGYRKFLYFRPTYQNYKENAREQGVRSILMERSDVEIKTHLLSVLTEDWRINLASQPESDAVTLRYTRELRDVMKDLPPNVAVIAYAREVQETAARILFAEYLKNPCPETENWAKRVVSYHFPHYEAGIEAAEALINMIEGDKLPRKKALHEILDFYNPELF